MAGAEMLMREALRLQSTGGGLYICGLKADLWQCLAEGGFLKEIGPKYFFSNKKETIHNIYQQLDSKACEQCQGPVFNECRQVEVTGQAAGF